jgi:hypothetical protein
MPGEEGGWLAFQLVLDVAKTSPWDGQAPIAYVRIVAL